MSVAGRGRGRGHFSDAASVTMNGDTNGGNGLLLGGLLAPNAHESNTTLPNSSPVNRMISSSSSSDALPASGRGVAHAATAISHRSDRTSNTASARSAAPASSNTAALPALSAGIEEYAAVIAASGSENASAGDIDDEIGAIDQAAFARTRNLMADNAAGTQTCLICQETVHNYMSSTECVYVLIGCIYLRPRRLVYSLSFESSAAASDRCGMPVRAVPLPVSPSLPARVGQVKV